ncbi:MAG: helix-turn-helix transcriptional regulator [Erysipelotrichaceae bacterium]|nr:helix-turn-helix transcriptional regulator [Erysipelotrichaceae bacterium]
MITYDPLWKTMEEKGITQYALINKYHVSPAQITRLKRNSNVNTNTINNLCNILEFDILDVISFTRDEK